MLTDDFERQDRRRLVGVPGSVGRAEYLRQQQTFFDLGSGRPKIVPIEFLATRGERLIAGRVSIAYPDGSETQLASVHRLNVACDKCELLIIFDPEGIDEVMAELERLHAEIEADETG